VSAQSPVAAPEPTATTEEAPEKNLSHDWVVAATIAVDEKVAKHANFRLSFKATDGQRIDALEVYCEGCRRPMDDVADLPCAAKIDNRHLIGGDQSVRAKRKVVELPADAVRVQGPAINRRGIDAVLSGEARG
jgi:hypothetical protein